MEDKLALYGLRRNRTLFESGNNSFAKREVVCQVTWHNTIMAGLFDFMYKNQPATKLTNPVNPAATPGDKSGIGLDECLQAFKQSESFY